MDVGTAAHSMFLEGLDIAECIPVDSYSKNSPTMKASEAKELRDAALAAGKIPLKRKPYNSALQLSRVAGRVPRQDRAVHQGQARANDHLG